MNEEYRIALSEVYTVLLHIKQEFFDNIPFEVIYKITVNKSEDYNFEIDEKDEELEELRAEKKKSTIINGLLKQGIADEDSTKIATAILKGDVNEITGAITNMHKNSTTDLQKQIDELKVTGIDVPQGSGQSKEITLEEFSKMSIDEKISLKISNPDLFNQLNKKHKER